MANNNVSGSKSLFEILFPYVRYIFKRLVSIIPVLIIMSVAIFILINLMPGDPILAMLDPEKTKAMTPEERALYIENMRKFLGYDKGPVERYFLWMGDTFRGEFGYSIKYNKPVNEFIGTYIGRSFKINIWGFLLAFLISIPVGITAAVKKNSFFDKTVTVLTIIGISLPSFFLALLLIMMFVIFMQILPFSGMSDPRGILPSWPLL